MSRGDAKDDFHDESRDLVGCVGNRKADLQRLQEVQGCEGGPLVRGEEQATRHAEPVGGWPPLKIRIPNRRVDSVYANNERLACGALADGDAYRASVARL